MKSKTTGLFLALSSLCLTSCKLPNSYRKLMDRLIETQTAEFSDKISYKTTYTSYTLSGFVYYEDIEEAALVYADEFGDYPIRWTTILYLPNSDVVPNRFEGFFVETEDDELTTYGDFAISNNFYDSSSLMLLNFQTTSTSFGNSWYSSLVKSSLILLIHDFNKWFKENYHVSIDKADLFPNLIS